eukprot:MONOS_7721.1-p1 / transcript=MONOS_7721.1 / gene=MONOS_7721 / organism=Monocercomonoides_exilis_PA203 / gene_product=unspecified product / transcript_product=unspecified product / location=Mono_scaffold00271:39619-40244(-) / protein_length=119 / sequence_SO=supercontig / SO=protein_coding / is_pseudo=false
MSEDNILKIEQSIRDWIDTDLVKIPPEIVELVNSVARCGKTQVDWTLLRAVLAVYLKQSIEECQQKINELSGSTDIEKDDEKKAELLAQLFTFQEPPITLQRLCEILLDGGRCNSKAKY